MWINNLRGAGGAAVILLALQLTACSAGPSAVTYASLPKSGSAEAGRALFAQGAQQAQACQTCHVENGAKGLGPSLKGIASAAAGRVAGKSADEYLFESIVTPSAHVVEGYADNLMPPNYGKALTPQQLRDLIEYLKTLN
jgi:mono/diheme cytochrome c family protein